ncbi:DnaA N-terminal domain-containing protein [Terriglobus sp. 2YAB30_2]|uniref:DnaA N-terminal domain-containing protein n=1 Tax=unclassified Terriglobus TaxID=2628988 RepID=UPI003F9E953B
MARIRTIKPDFFKHEDLFDLEQETGLPVRIAFAGLWTVADRDGRFEWKPRTLKTDVLPHDPVDFAQVLDALETRGFLNTYEVDGRRYGVIPSWDRHQVINNRESQSVLPPPPQLDNVSPTREPRVQDADKDSLTHAPAEGKGREGERKGREQRGRPRVDAAGLARGVLDELRLSGDDLLRTLTDVCKLELQAGAAPEKLRETLVESFRHFNQARPRLQITWGPARFFGEGHWRDATLWPWKDGASSAVTSQATVGVYRQSEIDEEARAKAERRKAEFELLEGANANAGYTVWQSMRSRLQESLDSQSFDTWIKPLGTAGIKDAQLILVAPNEAFGQVPDRFQFKRFLPHTVPSIRIIFGDGGG